MKTIPRRNKQKKARSKNKLNAIIVALVICVILATIFVLSPSITNQPINNSPINNATKIKFEAIKLMSSDSKKAKELFQQALAIYQSSKDTNNIIDTKSLIYLIDHK